MRPHREYKPRIVTNAPMGAAMSFEEIGAELGIGSKTAFLYYRRGMAKLRQRMVTLAKLRDLQQAKETMRNG